MKILITAKYVSGQAEEGGSSRFMHLVGQTLCNLGHEVIMSNQPDQVMDDKFDLIICSHNEILRQIKGHPAPKICIAHGLISDEHFVFGADRYISISEEIQKDNLTRGISSEMIGQPIELMPRKPPGETLKKILIIRRHPVENDPFGFLHKYYDVRVSDMAYHIEDQIKWADLCITVGRGALEAMAMGKPVIVADARPYNGPILGTENIAYGDGYITPALIDEMAKCNFSGRRFRIPVTKAWILAELKKYDSLDSMFLQNYICQHHEISWIVSQYLEPIEQKKKRTISFGVMINDINRFNMVLWQSAIKDLHYIMNPGSATSGLNKLLDRIEAVGSEIAILVHQDMYFRPGWIEKMQLQIDQLPDDWIVAGIIGKDGNGHICGRFWDTRFPQYFNTSDLHEFPHPACCFDECCIIVNMKSGFRFDEHMDGFDLYGTLAVLQAWEMGGSAWIIDAPAEHYCMRPFSWHPDEQFKRNYKWLWDRFQEILRVDSTALSTVDGDARDSLPKTMQNMKGEYSNVSIIG